MTKTDERAKLRMYESREVRHALSQKLGATTVLPFTFRFYLAKMSGNVGTEPTILVDLMWGNRKVTHIYFLVNQIVSALLDETTGVPTSAFVDVPFTRSGSGVDLTSVKKQRGVLNADLRDIDYGSISFYMDPSLGAILVRLNRKDDETFLLDLKKLGSATYYRRKQLVKLYASTRGRISYTKQ